MGTVGEVSRPAAGATGMAVLRTHLGGQRVIDQPIGEDLPRIC